MVPVTGKKRRSRKKQPQTLDPEAERQERELRKKIQQSLQNQQVSRTEVEETSDKAQQRSADVTAASVGNNVDVTGGGVLGNNQMNEMLTAVGFGAQPQMALQQPEVQRQYQYGYQNSLGMGPTNGPGMNMQQKIAMMKHQVQMQQIALQQQIDLQQMQLGQQPQPSAEVIRNLKYEQERLLKQTLNMGAEYQQYSSHGGSLPNQQQQQTTHQSNNPNQYNHLPYNFQNQTVAQQPQSYPNQQQNPSQQQTQSYPSQQQGSASPHSQQSTPQQSNVNNQQMGQMELKADADKLLELLRNSQETQNEKSLFKSGSTAEESWLKANSLNISSLSNSMAFHSVGNMSASFSSSLGGSGLTEPNGVRVGNSAGEAVEGGARNSGGASMGNNMGDPKKLNTSHGTAYTETSAALQPIHENETDDAQNDGGKPCEKESLMMSLNTFANSNASEANDTSLLSSTNDLAMSLDSTTYDALMKQSDQQSQNEPEIDFDRVDLRSPPPLENSKSTFSGAETPTTDNSRRRKLGDSSSTRSTLSKVPERGESTSSISVPSSESMDDNNQHKGLDSSVRSRGSNRSVVSKISMFSAISQWTKDNPFQEMSSNNNDPSAAGDGGLSNQRQHQQQQLQQQQRLNNGQKQSPVDMGDFHSVGGSELTANSLDM